MVDKKVVDGCLFGLVGSGDSKVILLNWWEWSWVFGLLGSKIFSHLSLSLAPKNCWKGLGQKDIFENTLFKRNVKFPLKTACHPSV